MDTSAYGLPAVVDIISLHLLNYMMMNKVSAFPSFSSHVMLFS